MGVQQNHWNCSSELLTQNCLQKLAPLFRRQRRRNHVARDAAFAAEKTENLVGVSIDGHKLRHRLAMFRDHHGLALGLDLVHDGETVGFECSCGNCFHSPTREPEFRLWSLYHSHSEFFDREGTSFTQPALSEVEGEAATGGDEGPRPPTWPYSSDWKSSPRCQVRPTM